MNSVGSLSPGPAARTGQRPEARRARSLLAPRWNLLTPAWIVVLAAGAMSAVGIGAISTTDPARAQRQALYLAVAMIAGSAMALLPERWLRRAAWPALIASIAMLVFVMLPGVPEWLVRPRNGSRRWINLGITDFQPSELAKIAWIMVMADWLRRGDEHRSLPGLLVPFAITMVPLVLVLIEPDLGTSLLFVPALLAMVLTAGARKRHLAGLVLIGAIAAPLTYPFLRPHQRERIDALIAQFQGDDRFTRDIGFQGDRAMTLAGAGGVWGAGREHARALVLNNGLPEEHNDMVFAVVACRWGLVGGLALCGAVLLITAGGLATAASSRDPFGRLVVVGVVSMIAAQAIVNVGMTVGVLPITGMTLPFVSYGGSSLVASWMMVGLVVGVGMRKPRIFERPSFEFGGAR